MNITGVAYAFHKFICKEPTVHSKFKTNFTNFKTCHKNKIMI